MQIIITLPDFEKTYQDLLPYMTNVSPEIIVQSLVDDLNGLLGMCHATYDNTELSPADNYLHLVTYILNSYEGSPTAIYSDVVKIYYQAMENLIYQISRDPDWINNKFELVRFRDGTPARVSGLTLNMRIQRVRDFHPTYGAFFNKLMLRTMELLNRG